MAQNVHHLADSHMNAYIRCRLILTEESPPLKPYDQDRWAELPDAAAADTSPSLALLAGLHTRWAAFWSSLAPANWARDGLHPENGAMTLADILRSYAAHGVAHLDQMSRTLLAQYAQAPASKEELLAQIDREWGALQSFVGRHGTRLEVPDAGGWSVKDNLAHLAAWERYLVRRVLQGQSAASAFGMDRATLESLEIDDLNAVILERSRQRSLEEVLEDAEQIHLEVVEQIEGDALGGTDGAARLAAGRRPHPEFGGRQHLRTLPRTRSLAPHPGGRCVSRRATYQQLQIALQNAGCPICRLGQEAGRSYLDGLLWESVNDPRIQREIAEGGGFCGRHSRELLTFPGSRLGAAILERAVLRQALQALDDAGAKQTTRRQGCGSAMIDTLGGRAEARSNAAGGSRGCPAPPAPGRTRRSGVRWTCCCITWPGISTRR